MSYVDHFFHVPEILSKLHHHGDYGDPYFVSKTQPVSRRGGGGTSGEMGQVGLGQLVFVNPGASVSDVMGC